MTRAGERMLTTALAAACGVFFVVALAMQFGLGRGYHWLDAGAGTADMAAAGAIDREPFELPPQTTFAAINQRPLFNDDRKPSKDEPVDTGSETPPPTALNISLTGTLQAAKPELRMAMVRENGKAQTIALREGMPLPGDQGGWTLSQVKSRSAIFKSTSGEEVEVELAMVNAGQNAGPQARIAGAAAAAGKPAHTPGQPPAPVAAQGDELQRRIEERRKQMREAAERMKLERQNEPPAQQQQQQQ
jgi:general secretion pathway protein N